MHATITCHTLLRRGISLNILSTETHEYTKWLQESPQETYFANLPDLENSLLGQIVGSSSLPKRAHKGQPQSVVSVISSDS